jgi:hypothetical protein
MVALNKNLQKVEVEVVCALCQQPKRVLVPVEGLLAWRKGMYIQDAMPDVSAEERELLISQTCPACFNEAFKEEE